MGVGQEPDVGTTDGGSGQRRLTKRSGRRFIGGSVVVSGERIAPGPPVGGSSLHEAATYVAGFGRDSAACGAVAQRSAGYVSVDVPVMRTVTTHSGRGFMVQARFAGDGSIYVRRQ